MEPDVKTELEEAVERLLTGKRDPEAMREACERMDKAREETRKKCGEMDLAVELIRDARK